MPTLLALLSNPDDEVKLRMDREFKEINRTISPAAAHDFNCLYVPAITFAEVPALILRERPDILHFSGHGNKDNLTFEDKAGQSKTITRAAILTLLRETSQYITCLFLNACHSSGLAEEASEFIPYTIGFPDNIEDNLSESFSVSFYQTLSQGYPVPSCFEMAKATIMSDLGEDRWPVLFQNDRLVNFNKIIFRLPKLTAQFQINEKGKPKKEQDMFQFTFDIKNLPSNTSYIIYEFIDDTIVDEDRFALVNDLSSGSYHRDLLYGNIMIRAWLWFGSKRYGIGIEASLKDCLVEYYGDDIPTSCKAAFKQIQSF